eukprot:TRINITY_DN1982_c0_g1_i2.p1 TRINITY_DN1982_c0_g1~~TRINITY_DN1982_c0_g1_i2.p1  ORF type:complete len:183 (-),score=61.24 TRINITY_DN1982_c0_g1_i2:116-664(-)
MCIRDRYQRRVRGFSMHRDMSPAKIALMAILFAVCACGDTDVVKKDFDTKVPELAEQKSAVEASEDEVNQDLDQTDDELPEAGVNQEQFAQAGRRRPAFSWFSHRRRSSLAQEHEQNSDDEMDQLPETVNQEQFTQAGRRRPAFSWWRRRSSLAQEHEQNSDDEDQLPEGGLNEELNEEQME